MYYYLFLQLFLLFSYSGDPKCTEIEQAIIYIESSLVSDMYYFGSWEPKRENIDFIKFLEKEGVVMDSSVSKEDIRDPLIWYMEERIPFDIYKNDSSSSIESVSVTKRIKIPNQKTTQQKANYLLFASDIHEGQLLVKLFDNRNPGFNVQGGKTEYESWSRMNRGMVYLFQFGQHGCITSISKDYESRD